MVAKLCMGDCKALRGRLQSFALADAKLCVWDGQKLLALQGTVAHRKFLLYLEPYN